MALIQTSGVVLKSIKYSETSIIAQIYTEKLGFQTYFVPGAYRKGSKIPSNFFQPLSLVELVVGDKKTEQLKKISQAKLMLSSAKFYDQPEKQLVGIFIAEVLQKILRNHDSDAPLFRFVEQAVLLFYGEECRLKPFLPVFLIHLIGHCGFYPDQVRGRIFDMRNGCFCQDIPPHNFYLDEDLSRVWEHLLASQLSRHTDFNIPFHSTKLLHSILEYYRLHLESFESLKSLDVIKEVLNS